MSVLQMLYQFLLEPLVLVFETIYGTAYNWMDSYGLAIIPLSLAVNFMLLPFYKRADALQLEEREAQSRMKVGLDHIKSSFIGDERFMMQQAYYRQNNYKLVYSLRSFLPLALEIPFFIAAYRFLSHIEAFDGQPLGPILENMGAPDQLLTIGGISLNGLPILMTLINMLSSEIYTRGGTMKEKLTLHGMAVVFLLLLYNSPSALVFYWTLNNLFSLVKNIVGCSKHPRKLRCIMLSILGAVSIVYASFFLRLFSTGQIAFVIIGLLLQIPTILWGIHRKHGDNNPSTTEVRGDTPLFCVNCLFLTLLTGILIPTATIVSSPAEFILASDLKSPVFNVLPAVLVAAGLFILWSGLFYYLAPPHIRGIFTVATVVASGSGIVNYLFFGTSMGTLLPLLQYEKTPSFTSKEMIINFEVLLLLATLLLVMWLKKRVWPKRVLIAACVAVVGLSAYNAVRIQRAVPLAIKSLQQSESDENHITLTTKGKNVVVIMVDRAVNGYLPYMFNERPELKKQYDGFIWYPNTLSYSNSTNTGAPAIYGGYDYCPDQMNKRSDALLVDKHNEALKTMPVLFCEAGYDVTICDPPYAGYNWVPDLSIFDDYPKINKFLTESGQFRDSKETDTERQRIWNRNFFCFSLMKASPLVLQSFLYQGGTYFDGMLIGVQSDYVQTREGISIARGYRDSFLDAYSALCAYPELTKTSNTEKNTFTMLYNSTAHNIAVLKEPEYEPALEIDNSEYDEEHKDRFLIDGRAVRVESEEEMMHYQCNMAATIKLGEWFDDLRNKGVYDNSRIIIVADHGALLGSFEDMVFGDDFREDVMGYNPLLMVKDFGSTGFTRNDAFMTNADTPTLAFEGLIANPVSPFTGNVINSEGKKEKEHHIFYTEEWQTNENNGTTFLPGVWMTLSSDNIFDMDSWTTTGKR